jgi:hypothetical protein
MFYPNSLVSGYIINPTTISDTESGTTLEDVYEIVISLNDSEALPEVRETGGRLAKTLTKWKVEDRADLHFYGDGSLCLCVGTEIPKHLPRGFNIPDFFNNLLVPFFFYQSYFEKFGKEPWSSYGHGDMGILESFQNESEATEIISDDTVKRYLSHLSSKTKGKLDTGVLMKGHHLCICGSMKIARKCHYKAMFGFNSLRKRQLELLIGT